MTDNKEPSGDGWAIPSSSQPSQFPASPPYRSDVEDERLSEPEGEDGSRSVALPEYLSSATADNYGSSATSGHSGSPAASGHGGEFATSGHGDSSVTAGHSGEFATSGHSGSSATSGHSGEFATSGHSGSSATSGHGGSFATSGHSGSFATSGHGGASTPPDAYSSLEASDNPPSSNAPAERPSKQRKFWIAGVAAMILVGIGAAFAVRAIPKSGANSPEEAIERFSEAAITQDWMNIAFMIEPTERRVFLEPLRELQKEFDRLGINDESETDIEDLDDLSDLTLEDLVTSVERVNDDIYQGWIDSAHVSGDYDFSSIPGFADYLGIDPSGTIDDEINTRDSEWPLALVERDGKWFVSITYTIAEVARLQTGSPPPDPNARLTPVGADSPEEAATMLVESMVALDFPQMIATMDPLELGAVYDYWSLFGSDLENGTDEIQSMMRDNVRIEVSGLEWDADTDGDDAWVKWVAGQMTITSVEPGLVDAVLAFDTNERFFSMSGTFEDSPADLRVEWQESKLTIVGNVESEPIDIEINTSEDSFDVSGQVAGAALDVEGVLEGDCLVMSGNFGGEPINEELCEPGVEANMRYYTGEADYPEATMRMRRVDDQWYFSPTSTMMDPFVGFIKQLEPEDVEAFEAAFEDGLERGGSVAQDQFDFEEETDMFGFLEGDSELESEGELEGGSILESDEFEAMLDFEFVFGDDPLGSESVNTDEVLDSDLGGDLKAATYDSVTIVVETTPALVEVSSDDFDTYMGVIRESTNEIVDINDDVDESTNSAIVIDEPGTYTVRVYSFDGSGGRYSMVVSADG